MFTPSFLCIAVWWCASMFLKEHFFFPTLLYFFPDKLMQLFYSNSLSFKWMMCTFFFLVVRASKIFFFFSLWSVKKIDVICKVVGINEIIFVYKGRSKFSHSFWDVSKRSSCLRLGRKDYEVDKWSQLSLERSTTTPDCLKGMCM